MGIGQRRLQRELLPDQNYIDLWVPGKGRNSSGNGYLGSVIPAVNVHGKGSKRRAGIFVIGNIHRFSTEQLNDRASAGQRTRNESLDYSSAISTVLSSITLRPL